MIDKYDVDFKRKAVFDLKHEKNTTLTSEFKEAEKVLSPIIAIIEAILTLGGR